MTWCTEMEDMNGPMPHLRSLPWPPTVNKYWRNVKGRTIISELGREYKREVAWMIKAAGMDAHLQGPLAVTITLHPPNRRKRDIDNTLKALLDAMQEAGVYEDDSQIKEMHVYMHTVHPGGRVDVEIERAVDITATTPKRKRRSITRESSRRTGIDDPSRQNGGTDRGRAGDAVCDPG